MTNYIRAAAAAATAVAVANNNGVATLISAQ